MRVYKDSIITDNLKSVIKTELTQNLINNITSNWQVKPDALVIYDHKYILHEVRNIQVNRKKLATCNDCSISVNNQWFRYSGINESKLFSDVAINVFFSYAGEYYGKFAGWLDKTGLQTAPNTSTISLTCRDNAKHFQERRISTPIFDETYFGFNNWHCTEVEGKKVGYQWTRGEIFKDVCYIVGMTDQEFEIQPGADDIIQDSFFDQCPLDVWAKLAQGILWETMFDGRGILVFKPQKSIFDPVEFYFKEERDLIRIGKEKTDDYLINDVILIGQTLEETAVTYPFAEVATLEKQRLEEGKALNNLIIGYPDVVSPDNLDTLENVLTSTTLIKDDRVFEDAKENPENQPSFDVRVHLPSYGQPFQKELVLDKTAMTKEIKNFYTNLGIFGDGITEKTFYFKDDQDFNETPIYLSDIIYVEEENPGVITDIKRFRGQVKSDYSLNLTEVDSIEDDEAPGLVYHRVYNPTEKYMDLLNTNTITGVFKKMVGDITKEVIQQQITIFRDPAGNIYEEGEWLYKVSEIVFDDPEPVIVNPESEYSEDFLISKNGDEEVYYRIITKYLVAESPASQKQLDLINTWLEQANSPENYEVFYYETAIENEEVYNKRYYKYFIDSGAKHALSKSNFLIEAKNPKNVVISCYTSSKYGGCSLKSVSQYGVEVKATNESPSLALEFFAIAVINQAATLIASGIFTPAVLAVYAGAGYILAYALIGASIPKFGHVQFGVKVWGRRKEEVLEIPNLASNADGWLNAPFIQDDLEPIVIWEKDFGAAIPIRQIGYRSPDPVEDESVVIQFKIYAYNRELFTDNITQEEILVDMTGYDLPFTDTGYWWDFFQRRDDFQLRNYRYLQFQLYKFQKTDATGTVDLLQQMIDTITDGDDSSLLYQQVFNQHMNLKDIALHVPNWLDEFGQELVEADVIYSGQNSAHINIDNQMVRDPLEVDIRVWGKAYGKYAPTLISQRASSERSINQYDYRNVEIQNPLITDDQIASNITTRIINSSKGEIEIFEWESTGKLQLFEGAIVSIKEESTGLASGLRFLWAALIDEPVSAPWRGRISLESSNRLLLVNRTDEEDEPQILEVDQNSEILWKCTGFVAPVDVQRLEYEGNTLIADYGSNQVIEVTYDPVDTVWHYHTGDLKPLSIHRKGDLTAIGLYSTGVSVARVIKTATKEIIFETQGTREPFRVQLLEDDQLLIADSELGWVRIMSLKDGTVIKDFPCTSPTDAHITEEGNLLICDAGKPLDQIKIVPRIWEQTLDGDILWEVDYSKNPDPIFTTNYICENFRPVSVDKDLSGNLLIVDQYNKKIYKVRPNSNIYVFEVTDEWTAPEPDSEGEGGTYKTRFRGISIEQAVFMQLTNFGRSYVTDQTSKQISDKNYIAEALIVEVLPGDRYKVETLTTEAEMLVSNATLETYRKNDTVLVSFTYGEKNGQRSIIGRKLLNGKNIEAGKPKTVTKADPKFWSANNTASVDLSSLKQKIAQLEQRIAQLEGGGA